MTPQEYATKDLLAQELELALEHSDRVRDFYGLSVKESREAQVPVYLLTDPRFEWVPSGQTDVTRIWRKYGWTPPSENKRERNGS